MTSALCAVILLALTACGGQQSAGTTPVGEEPAAQAGAGDGAAATSEASDQNYPDVIDAELEPRGDAWALKVTISSPERYADGWRVLSPDGRVLGEHRLAHDHADEQPFTRTQTGLEIPEGVDQVVVEGRDQENGYGGKTATVAVDRG